MGRATRAGRIVRAVAGAALLSAAVLLLWPALSDSLPREHFARDGSRMVLVPAGVFLMGPPPGREIYLDAFYMDEREITQDQYRAFLLDVGLPPPRNEGLAAWPYAWTGRRFPDGTGSHPVVGVTWKEARRYCRWAAKRLPTEAEWEKAARGPGGRTFPWGSRWESARLNSAELWAGRAIESLKDYDRFYWWVYKQKWEGRVVQTKPVGSFPAGASPYGVLDAAGNAAEWVADWFEKGHPHQGLARNPSGPAFGREKVIRGGAYDDPRWRVTTTFRDKADPEKGRPTVGFRCARTP